MTVRDLLHSSAIRNAMISGEDDKPVRVRFPDGTLRSVDAVGEVGGEVVLAVSEQTGEEQ